MKRWLPEIQQVQKLVRFAVNDLNEAFQQDSGDEHASDAASPPVRTTYRRRLREIENLVEELSKEYERLLRQSEERIATLRQELDTAMQQKAPAGKQTGKQTGKQAGHADGELLVVPASDVAGLQSATAINSLSAAQDSENDSRMVELRQRVHALEQSVARERELSAELTEQIEVERRTHAAELGMAQKGGEALQRVTNELEALRDDSTALSRNYTALEEKYDSLRASLRQAEAGKELSNGSAAEAATDGSMQLAESPADGDLATAHQERKLLLAQFENFRASREASPPQPLNTRSSSPLSNDQTAGGDRLHPKPLLVPEQELAQWRDRFVTFRRETRAKEKRLLARLHKQKGLSYHLQRQITARSETQQRLVALETERHVRMLEVLQPSAGRAS